MEKVKIVYENLATFGASWLRELLEEWAEFEPWDPHGIYDRKCLFYVDFFAAHPETAAPNTDYYKWCIDREYKILYDNLPEMNRGPKGTNILVMASDNWWWYNESLWWAGMNYNQYQPNKTYGRLGLMPLRRGRPHRDRLLVSMSQWLDDFIWSYIDHGKYLPNDKIEEGHDVQRDFRPEWYDDTHFSVVAESSIEPMPHHTVLLSEKTMKPIAFYHPFLIWGHVGSLQKLRSMGFETFENLFDESYDQESNPHERLRKIVENVRNYDRKEYDALTWEKLRHNHDRFWNKDMVIQRIRDEIIAPIKRFAQQ